MAVEQMEGLAVMYLALPMSPLSIPVIGACQLNHKRLTLKFPTSKIAFELPKALEVPRGASERTPVQEFKMAGPRGHMRVALSYDPGLEAFVGRGSDEELKYLTFILNRPTSLLANIKIV